MNSKILLAVLLAASTLVPGTAAAQNKPIKLKSDVQLLQPASGDGEAQLVAPEGVVPGDTLVFTTSYHNEGGSAVSNFVIVNPVPADLLLSDETAEQTEVSVDGGVHWGRLAELSIVDSNGQERSANSQDITHMRWAFNEVPPAATGQVRFSARVR